MLDPGWKEINTGRSGTYRLSGEPFGVPELCQGLQAFVSWQHIRRIQPTAKQQGIQCHMLQCARIKDIHKR